ncbi:MAG: hypothetical protein LC731_00170 [Acidobacteria bacterium]|nr:hypothetical protein [Acidobacteriota bacterium]
MLRILAYLLGCIAIASSFLIYVEYIHGLGFPDGFITELGYAQRKLARAFIAISVISGLRFFYLGRIAPRKKIGKSLSVAVIVYLVAIVSTSLIDYYHRQHLMDGAGG